MKFRRIAANREERGGVHAPVPGVHAGRNDPRRHDPSDINVGFRGVFRATCVAFGAICALANAPFASAQLEVRKADLILVNSRIWTGAAKPSAPEPTALAVIGDSIVEIGRDMDIRQRQGADTLVLDGNGRRVIPGITDSHTHMISGGFQLVRLNLRDVRGRDEFVKAVETAAQGKKKSDWVLGGRWSVESWKSPETPRARWVDPATGDTPVFLSRMDGHEALVNSAALKLAGIDKAGPADPAGGEIERDPTTREPTGILKESAMDLVRKLIPEPSAKERYEALLRAVQYANSLGVTSVHDMSQLADLDAFKLAQTKGELTIRITSYLNVDDWSKNAGQVAETRLGMDSKLLYLAGFKGFMDGSLGSRNAYMFEPYADFAPQTPYPRGQLTAFAASTESFQKQVADADAKGMQLAVHAIGDHANHLLLDAYESAMKKNDTKDPRHRVEHAQHLLIDDIPRFAKLGVVASMQPYHKADDGRYAEKALGSERLQGSYAFRQLVDAGALLIFGSDWPVVTVNPFAGIDSAVNANTLAGKVWLPSHSLTTEEALRAYTVLPPRAIHRGATLGVLEAPKFADFVILKDDPLTIPPDRLGRVRVSQTIVAGKVVFTAPE